MSNNKEMVLQIQDALKDFANASDRDRVAKMNMIGMNDSHCVNAVMRGERDPREEALYAASKKEIAQAHLHATIAMANLV